MTSIFLESITLVPRSKFTLRLLIRYKLTIILVVIGLPILDLCYKYNGFYIDLLIVYLLPLIDFIVARDIIVSI